MPHEIADWKLRYVCTSCADDPLQDPTARKWADSPLCPPVK
jgi:hypothetical protein